MCRHVAEEEAKGRLKTMPVLDRMVERDAKKMGARTVYWAESMPLQSQFQVMKLRERFSART